MITPQDIQTKEFERGVRGYKEEDVDVFLDELTLDYEAVLNENEKLKKELDDTKIKLREQQESVYTTLEAAKKLMADISASAEKRADVLIKNAQMEAEQLTRQSKENVMRLKEQESSLRIRVKSLKSKMHDLLENELNHIDSIESDIFGGEDLLTKGSVSNLDASAQFNALMEETSDYSNFNL